MLIIENSRLLEALGLNYRTSVGLKTWADLADQAGQAGPTGKANGQ
jgi:hypothetical protein